MLGVLSVEERTRARVRMESDAAFAALVWIGKSVWRPMADSVAPIAPPANLFALIARRLAAYEAPNVVRLKRQVSVWRTSALAFGAIAAALTIYFAVPALHPAPPQYVAVLETTSAEPAFVARIEKGKLTLKRVGAPAPTGRDYELWAVGAGREKAGIAWRCRGECGDSCRKIKRARHCADSAGDQRRTARRLADRAGDGADRVYRKIGDCKLGCASRKSGKQFSARQAQNE